MNFSEWTKKNQGRTGGTARSQVTQQEAKITRPTVKETTVGGAPSFSEWTQKRTAPTAGSFTGMGKRQEFDSVGGASVSSDVGSVRRSAKMGKGLQGTKVLKQAGFVWTPDTGDDQEALKGQLAQTEQRMKDAKVGVTGAQTQAELLDWQAKERQAREDYDRLTGELLNAQAAKRWRGYQAMMWSPDFEEKSRYAPEGVTPQYQSQWTGTMADTGVNDLLFDYVNGNEGAQRMQDSLDAARGVTHENWKGADPEIASLFNYIYKTQGKEAAYEFMDFAVGKEFTKRQAAAMGAAQGLGMNSALGVITGIAGKLAGAEETARESYGELLQDSAIAQSQHPLAYGAGNVGGKVAQMIGIKGALNAAGKALGLAEAIPMSPMVQGMANGAATFLTSDAIENAGSLANGYMDVGEYLDSAITSGIQGGAGGAAGTAVGGAMGNALRKHNLMTPFMEFARQTVTGVAASGANIGTGYALAEEKPTKEQVVNDLATAFLFSVIQGSISAWQVSRDAKVRMNAATEEIAKRYQQMLSKSFSSEAERSAAAQEIIRQTQGLRGVLNSQYIPGQQQMVNNVNNALDCIEEFLGQYVTGASMVPTSGTGGGLALFAGGMDLPTSGSAGMALPQAGALTADQGGGNGLPTQEGQEEDALKRVAEKVNPGARQTVRDQVGDMPKRDYQIPKLSMPKEALLDMDGKQVLPSKIPAAIRKYMIRLFRGKVLNVGPDHRVYIDKDGIEEFAFPVRRIDEEVKIAKMTAGANLDTTLEPSVFLMNENDDGHHPEATGGWDHFYTMFETDTGIYSGIVKTKVTDRGRVFQDITEIQKEGDSSTRGVDGEIPLPAKTESPVKKAGTMPKLSSKLTLSQGGNGVKAQDLQQPDGYSGLWTAPSVTGLPFNGPLQGSFPIYGGQIAPWPELSGIPTEAMDPLMRAALEMAESGALGDGPIIPTETPPTGLDGMGFMPYNEQGGTEISGIVPREGVADDQGAIREVQGGDGGPQAQIGDRSGIQKAFGGDRQEVRSDGLAVHEVQRLEPVLEEAREYHTPLMVVPPENWPSSHKDVPAYASEGNIYIRGDIPDEILGQVVPHEASHVMKQLGYQPYLGFIWSVPDKIDFSSESARKLLEGAAKHVGVDPFNAKKKELARLYDEITAMISSVAGNGLDSQIMDDLTETFYDYESFKAELLDIHQKFKDWRGSEETGAPSGETGKWMELPLGEAPRSAVPEGEPIGLTVRQRLTLDEVRYAGHSIEQVGMALKRMGPEAIRGVINQGLCSAPDMGSSTRGQVLRRKLDAGQDITSSELGHLYDALCREPTQWGDPSGQAGGDLEKGQTESELEGGTPPIEEGELIDGARRIAKSLKNKKRVVGFDRLPVAYQQSFKDGLMKATPEVQAILGKIYADTDYALINEHRSYYSGGKAEDIVCLGKDIPPSTIAHELFHKLDRGFKISGALCKDLTQDIVALNVVSGGNIKEYLIKAYPTIFLKNSLSMEDIAKVKYRGIADILNGISGGKTDYGYGHPEGYWKRIETLEAEAWAQFGRVQFENDPEAMKLFELLFPNFYKGAIIALKGLM